MLKKSVSQIDYDVDVDLRKIMDADTIIDMDADIDDTLCLYNRLMNVVGVNQVDYNGHFGNFLFLKINPEFDNAVMWMEIEKVYLDHIKDV